MAERWVIKLGGSLYGNPLLQDWLSAISEHGRGKAIIVPGGGSFADAVRHAQKKIGFDDITAHRMALLAMEQAAVMLAGMHSEFVLAKNKQAIETALNNKKIPLWLPVQMALAADDIPATWDMTSDSLAAWLAREVGATDLLLVKSCELGDNIDIMALAKRGIVDLLLPQFIAQAKFTTQVVNIHHLPGLILRLKHHAV